MAKNYIRNIARSHGVNTEELVNFLGAKNGSIQIDEDDPRIKQFLNRQKAADNSQENTGLNATTEGEIEYLKSLRRNARYASLHARNFYKQELIRCHNLSTLELTAEMRDEGDELSIQDDNDFFTMVRESAGHQAAVLLLPKMTNHKVLGSAEPQIQATETTLATKQEPLSSNIDSSETQQ